jgi:hypothetical protein
MMREDEPGALALLHKHRSEVIDPGIAKHRGRARRYELLLAVVFVPRKPILMQMPSHSSSVVLIQMPGVRDCAVFGIPDEEFREQVCAHVEPLPGAPIDAIAVRSYLGQHLARYKVPKVVELSALLPREDSGKIFKRKLRAPYWEKAGRSI